MAIRIVRSDFIAVCTRMGGFDGRQANQNQSQNDYIVIRSIRALLLEFNKFFL